MTEREILYWLSSVACAGRKTIRTLLENADPLSGLFEFDSETLELLQVPEELRSQLKDPEKAADETRRAMKRDRDIGIRFLTFRDPDWPERLSLIPDPPLWLHVRGSVPAAEEQTAAIIGSRGADIYGLRMAEFISRELAVRKISVISGMADGIDGAAQKEAVLAGGKSYAVLGCGVNICYPNTNYELFRTLSEEGHGGIVSEFAPGTPPAQWHFPDRNRLIAGLCDCLIVVEARGAKSGSQITVSCALDQGKEVFAVPGRLTDPLSRGCNDLIRNGANILTSPDDVLSFLGMQRTGMMLPEKEDLSGLFPEEQRVYGCLRAADPRPMEEIVRESGLRPGEVMSILLKLELRGLAVRTAGDYYAAALRRRKKKSLPPR